MKEEFKWCTPFIVLFAFLFAWTGRRDCCRVIGRETSYTNARRSIEFRGENKTVRIHIVSISHFSAHLLFYFIQYSRCFTTILYTCTFASNGVLFLVEHPVKHNSSKSPCFASQLLWRSRSWCAETMLRQRSGQSSAVAHTEDVPLLWQDDAWTGSACRQQTVCWASRMSDSPGPNLEGQVVTWHWETKG